MFLILFALFVAVPAIEIALFIQVGHVLGVWPTIGLVLLTAVVGASLVRSQGLQTLLQVQQRLREGELPAQQILEGVLLAVAGVLLVTPGFLTDILGMLLLLPRLRRLLAMQLMTKVIVQGQRQFHHHHAGSHERDPSHDGQTYEGEYQRKQDDDHRLR